MIRMEQAGTESLCRVEVWVDGRLRKQGLSPRRPEFVSCRSPVGCVLLLLTYLF